MNIYAANGNDEYALVGTCASTPSKDFSEQVVFTLPEKAVCDRIKIEFTEVSVYSAKFDGVAVVGTMDISLFKCDEGKITIVNATGNLGDNSYLASRSVTASEMKIRANGGGTVANAFDKNLTTYWQSESHNDSQFTNKLTLIFNGEQIISDIVYGCSYYSRGNTRNFSGFPVNLLVTATSADGTQTPYEFMGYPGSSWTKGDFKFPAPVTCVRLELEFREVTTFSEVASGAPIISTPEIYIVKTSNENLDELMNTINSLFVDYAQYELGEDVTQSVIDGLRERAMLTTSYDTSFKAILDRAEAVLTGALKKDIYREFSTDPEAKNPIEQQGNLVNYCRNTLQLTSFGTNRQVIGIGGTTGETITIYIDAGPDDPLPSVAFTQIYGAWNSWMRTYNLQRGKNEIVFPNFKAGGSYTRPVNAGGPIHVINPYTPEQQSSNVRMYIEGGYLYPVFHDGDDEGTFRVILKDYYERLSNPNDTSITIDAFEAVAGNVILSCKASLAYSAYVTSGSSPQNNVTLWGKYTRDSLAFGGIEFDETKPHYDGRNNYIKANYRMVQPYAGMYAFAASEHIGIIDSGTFPAMVRKWTLGWAFAHELGHMLDNLRMKIPEVTNNMWAIYNIYMVDGAFNDRINVSKVSANLASDFGAKVNKYYGNGNDNCDFWWLIEGGHPGYWAKLQQLYCYETTTITDSTEKLCYFSSLATGEDMCEYFKRWGMYFKSQTFTASNRFDYEKTSQTFKDAMAAAKAAGRIADNGKKFWYVNNDQYRYTRAHGGKIDASWASLYNSSQTVSISSVMGSAGNYTLILPNITNAEAHLCYEIQTYIDGQWKVAGITYGTSFTDTYAYGEGVTPRYRVYAYDRMFNRTGDPAALVPEVEVQTDVCRIGETKYNTLKEAVAAAQSGDVILLLKDFKDGGIIIDKNLTIKPDPDIFTDGRSVTLTKNSTGHLFTVKGSANAVFGTYSNSVATSTPIIIDGNGFVQSGSLFYIPDGGRLTLSNVTMRNNITTSNGGAMWVDYNAGVVLIGCTISNNRANDGGGIFLRGRSAISVRGITFTDNTATSRGGALCELEYTGTSNFHNNDKVNNAYTALVMSGNRAANGGAIYTQNNVSLHGAQITGNTATTRGGAIYTDIDNANRSIQLDGCTITGNVAPTASSIYMYRGLTTIAGGKIDGIIYKQFNTNPISKFILKNSVTDLSEAMLCVSLSIPADGLVLFDNVTGMTGEQCSEAVASFPVQYGRAEFVSGVGIKIFPKTATVTVNYGTESFTSEVNLGKYTLPERFDELPENKYITSYTIDGQQYSLGQSITVTGDFTVTATVHDYCLVTIIYGTVSEKLTFTQGTVYYLPMKTPEDEVVFGWNCSDGNYYAYAEGVEITRDMVFTAVIKRLHSVVTVIESTSTTAFYEYGGAVTLTSPPEIFGKVFSHWEIDGKKYQPNQTVKVTRDFTATAVYTSTWQVTTVIDDDEQTKTYANGSVIVFEGLPSSMGRQFKYWLINGVKYYVGSSFTVNCDCEVVAVFGQINTQASIEVTVVVNKGPLPDSEEIVENETTVKTYSFNDVHTFETPAVNEGNRFVYWNVNGVRYDSGSTLKVTEAFTAIAVVETVSADEPPAPEHFTVTVKDYVDGTQVETPYDYSPDTELFLVKPTEKQQGKIFSHWLVNGTRREAGETIVITESMSIEAVYDVAFMVTVTQKIDGELQSETFECGNTAPFTLPVPAKTDGDSKFTHWLVNGVEYASGHTFSVTENTQVTAVYEEIPQAVVTVKEYASDGTVTERQTTVLVGTARTLGIPSYVPDKKSFSHWLVNGVEYRAGATLTILEDTAMEPVYKNLYKLTVTKFSEGEFRDEVLEVIEGYSYVLKVLTTAPEGKIFSHWDVDGTRREAGDKLTVTGDMTVTAVYKSVFTVTVTKLVDGESREETVTLTEGSEYTLKEPDSVPANKVFSHWEVNGTRREAGYKFTITADTGIVAVYKNVYKVTVTSFFDGENREEVLNLTEGEKYVLKALTAAPEGKQFSHWEVNGTRYEAGYELVVEADAAIVAVYKDVEANGGNEGNEGGNETDGGSKTVVIVISAVAAAAVIAIAVTVAIVVKKKKSHRYDDDDYDDYDDYDYDDED